MIINKFNKKTLIFVIILLFFVIIGVILTFQSLGKEPVKVGFTATLTGGQAELGVQTRNGVALAIDEINAVGGIYGHPIELIIRDDLGTSEGAKVADQELIDAGVITIIGHPTSSETIAGLEITNRSGMIMISATSSSSQLQGIDDLFFRIVPVDEERAKGLADYIFMKKNITRLSAIYDTDNAVYVNSYWRHFKERFETDGGQIVDEVNFSSKMQPDFHPFLSKILGNNIQGMLIIAPDVDTALIAQRTRQMGWDIPMFSSLWAQTQTLINNGGQAVEGMTLEQSFPLSSPEPSFQNFEKKYSSRFGRTPSYGAMFGYEVAKVVALALEKTKGSKSGLKSALLETKNFKGLVDTFSIDSYGDVIRPYYRCIIENGSFKEIKNHVVE